MPILDAKDLPDLSASRFTEVRRRARCAAVEEALCTFQIQADIKEANEMFNIAPWPAPLSDIRTLVRKEDIKDPTAAP